MALLTRFSLSRLSLQSLWNPCVYFSWIVLMSDQYLSGRLSQKKLLIYRYPRFESVIESKVHE